jgi:hypothetical protein
LCADEAVGVLNGLFGLLQGVLNVHGRKLQKQLSGESSRHVHRLVDLCFLAILGISKNKRSRDEKANHRRYYQQSKYPHDRLGMPIGVYRQLLT